ncbi:MAG: hypothetical protein LBC99_01540 [Spirochaetota bacterium]|jgi:hypothetical protein|nr:hypothetical protein [Spirochaetota bacterium]
MKKIIYILCFLLLGVFPLAADLSGDLAIVGDAGYPASFQYTLGGAKALSAGYAWTVLGNDANSVFFNPATLLKIPATALSLSFNALPQDRIQGAAVFAFSDKAEGSYSTKKPRVFALSGAYQTVRNVDGYNDSGAGTDTLGNSSMLGQFSFASAFSPSGLLGGWGAGLRVVHENFDGQTVFGAAVNVGGDINIANLLRFGLSVNNLGLVTGDAGTLYMAPWFSAAAMLNLPMLPVSFVLQGDKVIGTDQGFVMRFAAEYRLRIKLGLERYSIEAGIADAAGESIIEIVPRIGLAGKNLHGGLSLRYNFIELSYGAGRDPLGGLRHAVSLDIYM